MLPHVEWPKGRSTFGRRAGTGILRPHMVSGNCYGAAPSINPVVFYLPSPASTPCSCSCDFLSSCLTTSQSTSIDDHYPLLDLLGYSRYGPYGSILAIVGLKCLFFQDIQPAPAVWRSTLNFLGEGRDDDERRSRGSAGRAPREYMK